MTRTILTVAIVLLVSLPAPAQTCREWRLRDVPGPSPRGEFGLAYDPHRDVTVLIGGSSNLTFDAVFRETWEWNGRAWTLVSTGGPTQRCDNAVTYDSTRQAVLSFGGYNGTFLRDTWTWDGTWVQRSTTGPSARADASIGFDPTDGTATLFGGLAGATVQADTWRWNGTTWSPLAPATVPPLRWIHRAAYDAARDEIVFFGGASRNPTPVVLGDMWAWNGSNWVQKTPALLPSARYANALAYDTHRQTVLLFGGQTGNDFGVGQLGDTWEWDGTNWVALPVPGPSARTFVKMAYDQRRRKLVLFGGFSGSQFVGDTWEFGSDLDIVSDPASVGVAPGAQAQLHVVATGTGPFSYQWLKGNTPLTDGGHVSGATTDTLVLDPAETGDSGTYSVIVSNACGPITSREATLLVAVIPGEASPQDSSDPEMLVSYDRATGIIHLTYTPACLATDHTIHWGLLALLKNYIYLNSVCGLGASGTASFNPGTGSYFFLISGNDGNLEGSYGTGNAGIQRPPDTGARPCTLPQNPNATCN